MHHTYLNRAIELAHEAERLGEVPVGAVIVHDNKIIGEGYNQPIAKNDTTAHAEIMAIRQACLHQRNYRLINCDLYVTLEPCFMCAGAIVHARIAHVYYGAADGKAGAVESIARVFACDALNHRVQHTGGILAESCGQLLKSFFAKRRG